MKKITAFVLSILFAVSIMGCATTQDKSGWDEQSRDTMKSSGVEQPRYPGLNPGP